MFRRPTYAYIIIPLLIGCSQAQPDPESSAPNDPQSGVVNVFVVNYPLKYFAQRIGGDDVNVVFPVPPDVDPAYWRPDTETIADFQKADLILLNGANYAKWIAAATLPESRLVDTSAAISNRYIEIADAVTHSHGPGDEHAHAGIALTTWLDPEIAVAQATAIEQALSAARPQHRDGFSTRLFKLLDDFTELDQQIAQAVEGHADQPLVFSHPVYQYLTRYYRLNGKSVHWEPDSVPTDKMRQELADLLTKHPAKVMIWEGPPIAENAKLLDEMGLRSVVFDPCGNVPDGDFISVMQRNAANLAEALDR